MVKDVRLSAPTLKVLKCLLSKPLDGQSGADIAKATLVGPGTMYPLLARLETAGWCDSEWEGINPTEAGRPQRLFYRLTAAGRARAQAAFVELLIPSESLAWNS